MSGVHALGARNFTRVQRMWLYYPICAWSSGMEYGSSGHSGVYRGAPARWRIHRRTQLNASTPSPSRTTPLTHRDSDHGVGASTEGAHINKAISTLTVKSKITNEEKAKLYDLLMQLLEANEPKAMIAVLRRVAARKALDGSRNMLDREHTLRWYTLAEALIKVENELE